jgi:hypothetical protein
MNLKNCHNFISLNGHYTIHSSISERIIIIINLIPNCEHVINQRAGYICLQNCCKNISKPSNIRHIHSNIINEKVPWMHIITMLRKYTGDLPAARRKYSLNMSDAFSLHTSWWETSVRPKEGKEENTRKGGH